MTEEEARELIIAHKDCIFADSALRAAIEIMAEAWRPDR